MAFALVSQFHIYFPGVNAAFNQEKALVGAFSVIVQLHRLIVYSTRKHGSQDPLFPPQLPGDTTAPHPHQPGKLLSCFSGFKCSLFYIKPQVCPLVPAHCWGKCPRLHIPWWPHSFIVHNLKSLFLVLSSFRYNLGNFNTEVIIILQIGPKQSGDTMRGDSHHCHL